MCHLAEGILAYSKTRASILEEYVSDEQRSYGPKATGQIDTDISLRALI